MSNVGLCRVASRRLQEHKLCDPGLITCELTAKETAMTKVAVCRAEIRTEGRTSQSGQDGAGHQEES